MWDPDYGSKGGGGGGGGGQRKKKRGGMRSHMLEKRDTVVMHTHL